MTANEMYENTINELRRGVIVLAVLSQLDEEQYGYSLMKLLSEQGLEIDQGTLYPLLRRLESQGLLSSDWNTEGSRPRRYYVISPKGQELLPRLEEEWNKIVSMMEESAWINRGLSKPEAVSKPESYKNRKLQKYHKVFSAWSRYALRRTLRATRPTADCNES